MDVKRHKTMRQTFLRVRFSDDDLARIASLMQNASDDPYFSIAVNSADEEDSFMASEPAFFTSEQIPRALSRIHISAGRPDGAITCNLTITLGPTGQAKIDAHGNDGAAVAGLFHELTRNLKSQQLHGVWLTQQRDSLWLHFVLSIVLAIGVYATFDLLLRIAGATVTGFWNSSLHIWLQGLGWICICLACVGGGNALRDRLQRVFPPVTLAGRLTDDRSSERTTTLILLGVVVLPIILNVLANFITDGIKVLSTARP